MGKGDWLPLLPLGARGGLRLLSKALPGDMFFVYELRISDLRRFQVKMLAGSRSHDHDGRLAHI